MFMSGWLIPSVIWAYWGASGRHSLQAGKTNKLLMSFCKCNSHIPPLFFICLSGGQEKFISCIANAEPLPAHYTAMFWTMSWESFGFTGGIGGFEQCPKPQMFLYMWMIISGMFECQPPGFGGIKDSPLGCGCHLNTYQLSVWKWNWVCERLWLYWRHWRLWFHDLGGQIFTCQTRENARTW